MNKFKQICNDIHLIQEFALKTAKSVNFLRELYVRSLNKGTSEQKHGLFAFWFGAVLSSFWP